MIDEGFWSVDAEERCVYVNQNFADMLGYRVDELIGRRMTELAFEEDLPEHFPLAVQRDREDHGRGVLRLRRKDGAECWMVISASMETDSHGRPLGGQGMAIDVTRQKADEKRCELLESQLQHAARLATLGELAAGIAHEINQPLCSIVNFAKACNNVASQPQPDLRRLRQWSEAIAMAAARGGDIVRRLCGFARHSQHQPVTVDVKELIDDAIMLVRFDLQSRKVAIRKEIPNEALAVSVYPVQIHQVLVNLLRNAIEALDNDRGDGQLTIRVQHEGNDVHVSVTDNGVGLPDMETGDIFAAFFTTKQEGLGLGLAISRSIIETHRGRIWAEANPQRGATVHFTLPLHEERDDHASQAIGLRG
jgi:PAS domain S-box-containing protein